MMCAGAVVHARLRAVYFLAPAEKGPGLRRLLDLHRDGPSRLNHFPEVIQLDEFTARASQQLRAFFQERR